MPPTTPAPPTRPVPQPTGGRRAPHVPLTVWLCPPDQQPADQLPPPLLHRLTAELTARRPTGAGRVPLIRTVTRPTDLHQMPEWAAQLVPGRPLVTVSRNTHRRTGELVDLAGATVTAAAGAGLVYRQHLVLLEAGATHATHVDALLFTHPGDRR
jgi:hypothetical protein